MSLIDRILTARGIGVDNRQAFLSPDYSSLHDPFLLPDMDKAVKRLIRAKKNKEKIVIYGDYDIDGLTASTLLVDAFNSLEYKNVEVFIPNRFVEGYGMTVDAVEKIASGGANLIITVDCGSLSHVEIEKANSLGVDVIVTDHHNVADVQPLAAAVINPKRSDSKYPFADLASVGVAFKLVQAMQTKIEGLEIGQEKWLLDLVALGTVCDIVSLTDENRILVHWGLKVLKQTRRPGLVALMKVATVEREAINARTLGFVLGPRMNAAGRLETAQIALDMLLAGNENEALEHAQHLDDLNIQRRIDQDKIFKEAIKQADKYKNDSVLVLSGVDWNHGIVGIVASKILERYKKPAFVLQEIDDIAKGSARSYGNFSAADALKDSKEVITKGGGHKLAAGVTLPKENIETFRRVLNEYYHSLFNLRDEQRHLLPMEDLDAQLDELTESEVISLDILEPFGNGNKEPVIKSENLTVRNVRTMGADGQHVKIELHDSAGHRMHFLAFNARSEFFVETGTLVTAWYHPGINEWQGRRTVEGRLLHIEIVSQN
ncbi:MAG: single-stranded-DNA-specific exonuclease RecJ [Candidatus Saccharimonadales bacterium]